MIDTDVASIERATLAAVAPETLEEREGWLVPADRGTVGRAKSAVPLQHAGTDPGVIGRIEAHYAALGLPAAFRLATTPCLKACAMSCAGAATARTNPRWCNWAR